MRLAGFDGAQIPLEQAMIAQGAQTPKLALADALAGRGERLKQMLAPDLLVVGNQLPRFIPAGVSKRSLNSRQLERNQHLRLVRFQEELQRGDVIYSL